MKVKSFIVGIVNGIDFGIKKLDQQVNELGDILIHTITDTFYSDNQNQFGSPPGPLIVRVVVYTLHP